jgi:hypothetical protein
MMLRYITATLAVMSALSLPGCSNHEEGPPKMSTTLDPTPSQVRAAGDEVLAAMRGIAGSTWDDDPADSRSAASDCYLDADKTRGVIFQWAAGGSLPTDVPAYVERVRVEMESLGLDPGVRKTTLELYGTSYQIVGSSSNLSAVSMAVNDGGTLLSMSSSCVAGDVADYR